MDLKGGSHLHLLVQGSYFSQYKFYLFLTYVKSSPNPLSLPHHYPSTTQSSQTGSNMEQSNQEGGLHPAAGTVQDIPSVGELPSHQITPLSEQRTYHRD